MIITIALLLAMQVLVNNFASVTNGSNGVNVPLPFWSSDYQNMPFYYLFLVLLLATVGFAAWVRRTKFGTGLLAIREDEDKAAAIGVNTTRYKVLAYAASAVPIGVAGVVYAYFLSFLNPIGAFSLLTSVTIVLSALLGGRGTLWGPVLGGFVVVDRHRGGQRLRRRHRQPAARPRPGAGPRRALPAAAASSRRSRRASPGGGRPRRQSSTPTRPASPTARTPIVVTPRSAPQAEQAAAAPLLEIRGAAKSFGGLRAVDGVDLTVEAGSITALIGPERLGQDDAVQPGHRRHARRRAARSGSTAPGSTGSRPWDRAHLGLGRTFQITRLFKSMTVLENVVVPAADGELGPHGQGRRQRARGRAGARAARLRRASAASATSRPAPSPTASRSSSSWRRCSCSSRR